jgi:hypothetical protein
MPSVTINLGVNVDDSGSNHDAYSNVIITSYSLLVSILYVSTKKWY